MLGFLQYNFHPVAINLLVECAKLTFATATLMVNVSLSPSGMLSSRFSYLNACVPLAC